MPATRDTRGERAAGPAAGVAGTVYLLHFASPYRHARHYIGWARNLEARLAHHRAGTGARLTAAASEAGIPFEVVRLWPGEDRHFERRLHNRKSGPRLCPICATQRALPLEGHGRPRRRAGAR
jgi:hypothetical protein